MRSRRIQPSRDLSDHGNDAMRILWVTSAFPDIKGTGGMVHEFELLRAVAKRHDITLISTFWLVRQEALRVVEDLGVRVELVPWPWERAYQRRSRIYKLTKLLAGASPNFEIWSRRKRLEPLGAVIRREESAHQIDLVFVIQGELAPVLGVAKAPTALLLYDVYSRLAALVRGRATIRSIRYRLEGRNAGPWESSAYRKAGAIACVSALDANIVSHMVGRPVETIVNPVPDEFFEQPAVPRSDNIVTIIGSFGWEPNIDSVNWMCEEIWPLIRRARPDARLRVVGRFSSPELRRTVADAGGEFHGDVPDIRPYYWEAALVLANIRMGSGMRNKVLHAMACRAPVVATSSALEGIDPAVRDALIVADDSAGLAEAIIATLNDHEAACARAEASVGVAARYSSGAAGAALERWWVSAVPERSEVVVEPEIEVGPAPTASVVLATKERPELLKRSLASIRVAATQALGTEIIVVEQGEPFAKFICDDLGLDATVITSREVGVSKARNEGINAARGDIVLFTDDDCEVPPDWIACHIEALRDIATLASFGAVIGLRYDEEYDPVGLPSRHDRRSPPWMVGHASNMAARTETLRRIGGFDERMGPGTEEIPAGEDADLIVRILRAGDVCTGTGEPVRHIDWRSSSDRRGNLMGYEHGAGAWIGKALRDDPRAAIGFLKSRLDLQRGTVAHAKDIGDREMTRGALIRAFARGLLEGIKLKPWRGSIRGGPAGP